MWWVFGSGGIYIGDRNCRRKFEINQSKEMPKTCRFIFVALWDTSFTIVPIILDEGLARITLPLVSSCIFNSNEWLYLLLINCVQYITLTATKPAIMNVDTSPAKGQRLSLFNNPTVSVSNSS